MRAYYEKSHNTTLFYAYLTHRIFLSTNITHVRQIVDNDDKQIVLEYI